MSKIRWFAVFRRSFGVLAIATLFALCGAVVFWQALVHTLHLGTVAIPDLTAISTEEAEQIAHDVGLLVEVEDAGAFSASVNAGAIATQDPLPGFHVKTGSVVRVRISLGNQRVTVPDLHGLSLQAAQRDLEAAGLSPGAQVRLSAHTDGDHVVASEPPAGTAVPPKAMINLLVNVTPKREIWVMPSFLSRSVGTVRSFCRNNHVRLGHIHEVYYPGFSGGTVLRQYPAAGSPMSRSDIVTVWASR